MFSTLLAAFLVSQSPSASVISQPQAGPAITDFVVVSASFVDVPLSRVTDSVTVIPRSALDARQIDTVAGALRSVTGLGVTALGGRGGVTSLFTRGGESDYTLLLVDGVPVNEFGGSLNIAHLSLANVDRIEVVRGPQSAVHGAGAIAGVINVLSGEGGPARATATAEGGTESTYRAALDARGVLGAWSVGGGGDHLSSAGYTGRSRDGAPVTNDDYARTEVSAIASRPFGASRARVSARWNDNARGFPGPFGSNPAGNYGGVDSISRGGNQTLSARGSFDGATGRVTHRASAGWMHLASDFVSPFGESTSSTRRATARYIADWPGWPGAAGGVSAGAEITRESGRSTFIVDRAGAEIPVERTLAGYFAEARGAMGSRMLFTAGARLEQIHRAALPGDASPFGARPDMDGSTIWSFNPRVSAVLYLTPPASAASTRVRGGFSTGIRPPSAFELSFTDNPGLRPERNRSGDVALEQTLAHGAVTLGATAFWNRYDDLIITVGRSIAGSSRYRSDNLSNSNARGIELALSARASGALEGLSMRGGYTWLQTRILAADGVDVTGLAPFTVGDRLLRRPAHRAFLDATFTRGALTAFASTEARGETLDVEPSFGLFGGLYDNPGYTTSAAGLAWRLSRHVDVFGRVTNLFDRDYEEVFGFPAPGRQLMAGARIAAGR